MIEIGDFELEFRKWVPLLLNLYEDVEKSVDSYASQVAKDIDCTYSHVVKMVIKFEDKGLIKTKKQGRLRLIRLTKKGTELAEHLYKANYILKTKE